MAYEITHVRVDSEFNRSEDHITDVKLSDGTVENVREVVIFIDRKMEYFFTDHLGSRAQVESVHPTGRAAYIRTKPNQTTADNLLSLPRF
ncbi:DUF3892 domain-containing protein [Leuconostoc lactis]|uniref:DUF3892 domain-containing protein n=1 Tax=Leuconostoc lactis TaxID=1246 RepID=UPI001D1139C6|nr:DUF3892 domain-containing protein [Leuconostoc lactis]MCC2745051.1 DUF3892 domain-containing protein [Leuconostoc lactis]MCC2755589.1 DUF3892 domain-containing protein [Leuconostoc lactis]